MRMPKIPFVPGLLIVVMAGFPSASYAKEPGHRTTTARAAAVRECSLAAAKYPDYSWGNTEIYVYRTCMAKKGQRE